MSGILSPSTTYFLSLVGFIGNESMMSHFHNKIILLHGADCHLVYRKMKMHILIAIKVTLSYFLIAIWYRKRKCHVSAAIKVMPPHPSWGWLPSGYTGNGSTMFQFAIKVILSHPSGIEKEYCSQTPSSVTNYLAVSALFLLPSFTVFIYVATIR